MDKYIKCPRCEINYIIENTTMCDVCKAELKIAPDIFSEEEEDMILCPGCGKNYIFPDESKCSICKKITTEEEDVIIDAESDEEDGEEWRSYLDPEPDIEELPEGMELVAFDDILEEENEADEEDSFEDTYAYDYDDNFDDIEDGDDIEEDDDDDDDEM